MVLTKSFASNAARLRSSAEIDILVALACNPTKPKRPKETIKTATSTSSKLEPY